MPSAVAATSILSRPIEHLAKLIANSSNFRTIVGAANATDALNFIHSPHVNPAQNPEASRPWAVVTDEDADSWLLESNGSNTGELVLTFEFPIPEEYLEDDESADIYFRNQVGFIIEDLITLNDVGSGAGSTYMKWRSIKGNVSPGRNNPDVDQDEHFCGCSFRVHY